jgi:hypothetical protein
MRGGCRRSDNYFEGNTRISPYIFIASPDRLYVRGLFGNFVVFTFLLVLFEILRFFERFSVNLLEYKWIDYLIEKLSFACDDSYKHKIEIWTENSQENIARDQRKMEEIMKRGLPAQAIAQKESSALQRKVPVMSLEDEIPKGKNLYAQNSNLFNFLKNTKRTRDMSLDMMPGNQIVEMKHIDVGTLTPGENEIIDIKLVPEEKVPKLAISDFQVRDKNRYSRLSTAIHVGAIEVIFDSYASPDSDIVGGMLLVDTHHTRPNNAIRSVFVTSLAGGRPVRVLMFPNTLVEINEKMNERFKLVCTTSNGDFAPGCNLASVKVNIVGCTVSLSRTYTPSDFLENELRNERGTVIEYLGKTSYVMHNTNEVTPEMIREQTLDFKLDSALTLQTMCASQPSLKRSNSLRFVVGGEHGGLKSMLARGTVAGKSSMSDIEQTKKRDRLPPNTYVDPVEGEITVAYGQAQGEHGIKELFDRDPGDVGPPLHARVARSTVRLTKAMTGGSILFEGKLANILVSSQQRYTTAFTRTHVMNKKLVAMATIGIPENTGCCLMMCYNSSVRGKAAVDAYTASSQAHHVWNPACKRMAKLEINPNPCQKHWSYQYLRQSNCHFSVLCVSGWTATPMTDLSMTIDWYFSEEDCQEEIYCLGGGFSELHLNRWMGRLIFPQGVDTQLKRMPLAIGGGAGGTGRVYMNMTNALVSMWRYIHGGVEFDIIKMSSPYIKSTIAFFIAFTDIDVKMDNLEAYPHKLVQFGEIQERVKLYFGPEDFATAWSTQVRSNTPPEQIGCPYLYALTHDSTGSTLAGDFNLGVVLTKMTNFQGIGRSPGWIGALPLQIQPQALRKSGRGVYNKMFQVRTPPEAKETDVVPFSVDLIGIGIAVPSTPKGTWSLETYNTPLNNLLRTATWKRGTLHVQVLMEGNFSTKRADWASFTDVVLLQSGQRRALSAREWTMKDPHSWELEFEIEIIGPNEGFESWENQWANQTTWVLEFTVFNTRQSVTYYINGYLDEDFCCAGNTLMPPFIEPETDQHVRRNGLKPEDFRYTIVPTQA